YKNTTALEVPFCPSDPSAPSDPSFPSLPLSTYLTGSDQSDVSTVSVSSLVTIVVTLIQQGCPLSAGISSVHPVGIDAVVFVLNVYVNPLAGLLGVLACLL